MIASFKGVMSFSTDKLRSLLNPNTAPSASASSSSSSAAAPSGSTSSPSPPPVSPLLDTLLRTYELPVDSSALEQIELCVDASLQCVQAGSRRKAAFFLIQAAGLYQELHQYAACTTLLQAIGQVYKLDLTGAGHSAGDDTAGSARQPLSAAQRYERGESNEPWVALQRSILEHIVYAAHKSNSQPRKPSTPALSHVGADEPLSTLPAASTICLLAVWLLDVLLAAYSILQLLASLHDHLDTQYQASLAASLRSLSSTLPIDTHVDCMGLPALLLLSPVRLPASQQPHRETSPTVHSDLGDDSSNSSTAAHSRLERIGAQETDVFLFSPDTINDPRHRTLATLRYCAGEVLQVEATLTNPLRISLHVQSIQLLAEGVSFAAHSTHLVLQPEEEGRRVLLTGRAEVEGKLKLLGCAIRCFNLTSDHLVDRVGRGLPPPHVSHFHTRHELTPVCRHRR